MKIQGHLRDYPLDDLLEILVNRHESGCLRIEFEPEPALLYFDNGTLVDADMSFLRGFPAVHLAFSRAEAPFAFDNQVPPPAVANIDENERQLLSEMLKVRLSGESKPEEITKPADEKSAVPVESTPEVNMSVFAKAIESASAPASHRAPGIRHLFESTFNRSWPRPAAVGTSTPASHRAPGIRHLFETAFNRSQPRPAAVGTSTPPSLRALEIRHLFETTFNQTWHRLAAVGTSILASLRALEIRHLFETTFNRSWSRLAAVGTSILASLRALEIRHLFETTFNRSWSRLAAVGTSLLNLLNQVSTRTLLRAAAMVLAVAIPVTVGITVFLAKKNASEQVVAATPESKSVAETTAQPVAETKKVEGAVTPIMLPIRRLLLNLPQKHLRQGKIDLLQLDVRIHQNPKNNRRPSPNHFLRPLLFWFASKKVA
jgi:hypothetical protein